MFNESVKVIGTQIVISTYHDNTVRGLNNDRVGNDFKLYNNMCRARSKVREYVACNNWDYFGTLTFSDDKFPGIDFYNKSQRAELVNLVKKSFLRNYKNRVCADFKYLFIPEWGTQTERFHLHCCLANIPSADLEFSGQCDKHGRKIYYWLSYSKKFGFSNLTAIDNIGKVANYVTKYIVADIGNDVPVGQYAYYASKGLNTAYTAYKGVTRNLYHDLSISLPNGSFSTYEDSSHGVSKITVYTDKLDSVGMDILAGIFYDKNIDLI